MIPRSTRRWRPICLKAMATEPEDRYATPKALADDIERWMADEPVTAWREPFSRRARRWARRNRTAVTAAAVALVAGVVGLAAVLAVQTRAKADLRAAETGDGPGESTPSWPPRRPSRRGTTWRWRRSRPFTPASAKTSCSSRSSSRTLRDRLLKSASDFYGKLGALLGKESDLASRRALARPTSKSPS